MTNIDSTDISPTDTLLPVVTSAATPPTSGGSKESLRKRLHIPKPSVIFATTLPGSKSFIRIA